MGGTRGYSWTARAVVAVAAVVAGLANGELVMVQTLTRHGERAPDKIITQQSCKKLWPSVSKVVEDFEARPGRLTPLGVQRMRDVGVFLRERYIEGKHWGGEQAPNNFVGKDYQSSLADWDFVARMGYRQQRSMAAVALGIFPNEPVPVSVVPRLQDTALGGPAPACGKLTADMIVEWHKTHGKELVGKHWDEIAPFEKICNVSGLKENPVNAEPGGPNPHAWLGDISDTLDSAFSCGVKLPESITPELHEKLTRLAFELQERSHYDDPRGAIYFVGDFASNLLSSFQKWADLPATKSRPKKMPLLRLFSCSRELMYGLEHMFGWETSMQGQPKGRVVSGTTFIWELHASPDPNDGSRKVFSVRSYWWNPADGSLNEFQPETALGDLRKQYEDYVSAHGGPWQKQCDYKHFNEAHNHHEAGTFVNPNAMPMEAKLAVSNAAKVDVAPADDAEGSSLFSLSSIFALVAVGALIFAAVSRGRSGGYQQI